MKINRDYFRPCIDLHEGNVKQIVGSTLTASHQLGGVKENYIASEDILHFAEKYADYGLTGGHIIMLDRDDETVSAAKRAVMKYPELYQVGGGMDISKGKEWLSRGAEKIILSSHLFLNGKFSEAILAESARSLGKERLVVDLSSIQVGGHYYAVIHGWKTITDFVLSSETLKLVGRYSDEILIHAIAQEGLREGIDQNLFELLAHDCPVPFVYAGGIHSLEEVELISKKSREMGGRIGFTIGSGLDIFGGDIPLEEVLALTRRVRVR